MTADHADLIARLEAAAEGSRELSDEVLVALVGLHEDGRWLRASWFNDDVRPDPTRSVDDALALVPEGVTTEEVSQSEIAPHPWYWRLSSVFSDSRAATPALALCAAILRAKGDDHAG